jgi:protein-disulfide isomerase
MANRETETDVWVDDRLQALKPPADSSPNTVRALAIIREKIQRRNTARTAWWWLFALPISALSLLLFIVPSSRACAQRPDACAVRVLESIFPAKIKQPEPVNQAPAKQNTLAASQAPERTPVVREHPSNSAASAPELTDYKQVGSTAAPVTFEIYLDYQCPPCSTFFQNVIPQLKERYVDTGKLRLLFRDYPLPTHRYAKLAAQHANAAGQVGYYDAAMRKIFETQAIWSADGDVDSQVALVIPPDMMEKVRDIVRSDATGSVEKDEEAAHIDNLHQTPSVVAVHDGQRELIPGPLSLERLKAFLEPR